MTVFCKDLVLMEPKLQYFYRDVDLHGTRPTVFCRDFGATPPVLKILRAINVCVYYRSVICYRGAPCAGTIFLGFTDISSLKQGFTAQ